MSNNLHIMKIIKYLFICLIIPYFSFSQVVINEVSCSNRGNATDAFGENDDWVALYNTGTSQVDLSGYYLSDRSTNVLKWQVPAGATINAGGTDFYMKRPTFV